MHGRRLRHRCARVEPAAQRADQRDMQRALPPQRPDQLRALVDQREIRDVDVLLHQHPAPVPVRRDLHNLLRGVHRVLLLRDERLRGLQRRDELRDLPERVVDGLVVQADRDVRLCDVRAELRLQPPAIEDRQRHRRADRARERVALEQRRGRQREHAAERDEVHVRIELRARRVGTRIRGLDAQPRGDDVGPAAEQVGRQPRGQRRIAELADARALQREAALGATPRQHAKLQLRELDLLVVQRDLREQAAALDRCVARVVRVVEAARGALTQHRRHPLAHLLLLLQQVARGIRLVEPAVHGDDRRRQREPHLFGLDARGIAQRHQALRRGLVPAPQVELVGQPDEHRRRRHDRIAEDLHRHLVAARRHVGDVARLRHARAADRRAGGAGQPGQRIELLKLRLRDPQPRLRDLQVGVLLQRVGDQLVELRILELRDPVRRGPRAAGAGPDRVRERVVGRRAQRQ